MPEEGFMQYRFFTIIMLLFLALALMQCGDGYVPGDKNPTYPDSVYGKAKFGKDKYN